MRIMHVMDSLEIAGAQKVVLDLIRAMEKKHEISVCCLEKKGEWGEELEK